MTQSIQASFRPELSLFREIKPNSAKSSLPVEHYTRKLAAIFKKQFSVRNLSSSRFYFTMHDWKAGGGNPIGLISRTISKLEADEAERLVERCSTIFSSNPSDTRLLLKGMVESNHPFLQIFSRTLDWSKKKNQAFLATIAQSSPSLAITILQENQPLVSESFIDMAIQTLNPDLIRQSFGLADMGALSFNQIHGAETMELYDSPKINIELGLLFLVVQKDVKHLPAFLKKNNPSLYTIFRIFSIAIDIAEHSKDTETLDVLEEYCKNRFPQHSKEFSYRNERSSIVQYRETIWAHLVLSNPEPFQLRTSIEEDSDDSWYNMKDPGYYHCGWYRGVSLLKTFNQSHPDSLVPKEILEALERIFHPENSLKSTLNDIQNGHLVFLPSVWETHVAFVVFYGNMLIKCNRGQSSDFSYGVHVYEYDKTKLNENVLYYALSSTEKYFNDGINDDLDAILNGSISQKPHRNGTCVWSSIKSAILAGLFAMQPEYKTDTEKADDSLDVYKKFTYYVRERVYESWSKSMDEEKPPTLLRVPNCFRDFCELKIRKHRTRATR